ncbi:uncharacterized protein LOC132640913 [Lycium barbarum]|uniref:uncharacterized protein LOC132640913 n=2 Tax=Lycium barbarum TaxID=112863 RepID=UPI00293E6619|nr:uncharacterized protein LOC132640913 [Lycium barbarum]
MSFTIARIYDYEGLAKCGSNHVVLPRLCMCASKETYLQWEYYMEHIFACNNFWEMEKLEFATRALSLKLRKIVDDYRNPHWVKFNRLLLTWSDLKEELRRIHSITLSQDEANSKSPIRSNKMVKYVIFQEEESSCEQKSDSSSCVTSLTLTEVPKPPKKREDERIKELSEKENYKEERYKIGWSKGVQNGNSREEKGKFQLRKASELSQEKNGDKNKSKSEKNESEGRDVRTKSVLLQELRESKESLSENGSCLSSNLLTLCLSSVFESTLQVSEQAPMRSLEQQRKEIKTLCCQEDSAKFSSATSHVDQGRGSFKEATCGKMAKPNTSCALKAIECEGIVGKSCDNSIFESVVSSPMDESYSPCLGHSLFDSSDAVVDENSFMSNVHYASNLLVVAMEGDMTNLISQGFKLCDNPLWDDNKDEFAVYFCPLWDTNEGRKDGEIPNEDNETHEAFGVLDIKEVELNAGYSHSSVEKDKCSHIANFTISLSCFVDPFLQVYSKPLLEEITFGPYLDYGISNGKYQDSRTRIIFKRGRMIATMKAQMH